jgi:endogenous inhibitor of DNA gyrase (YacG/DUF329 family)
VLAFSVNARAAILERRRLAARAERRTRASLSAEGYSLPAMALCPGCGTMVVLPAEPLFPDSPPAICATCGSEVPDYRRDSYRPSSSAPPAVSARTQETPPEERRYSRAGLLRSLGGILAERGVEAVESAKDRFTT